MVLRFVQQQLFAVLGHASPWLLFQRAYIYAGLLSFVGVLLILLNSVTLSGEVVLHLDPQAPALSLDVQDPFIFGSLSADSWAYRCSVMFTVVELLNTVEQHPSAVLDALPMSYCADPEFFIDFGLPRTRLEDLYLDSTFESWPFPGKPPGVHWGLSYRDFLQSVSYAQDNLVGLQVTVCPQLSKLATHAIAPDPIATLASGGFADHYRYWSDPKLQYSTFEDLATAIRGTPIDEGVPHMENPTREGLPPFPWFFMEAPRDIKQTKFQALCAFLYAKTFGLFL